MQPVVIGLLGDPPQGLACLRLSEVAKVRSICAFLICVKCFPLFYFYFFSFYFLCLAVIAFISVGLHRYCVYCFFYLVLISRIFLSIISY